MSEVCEICGEGVTSWSARYKSEVIHCKKCFGTEKAEAYIKSKHSEGKETDENEIIDPSSPYPSSSSLPTLFNFLAWISLLTSVFFGLKLLPSGYSIPVVAYIPTFTWVAIGVVQFAIFLAISKVLIYLKQIVINTSVEK